MKTKDVVPSKKANTYLLLTSYLNVFPPKRSMHAFFFFEETINTFFGNKLGSKVENIIDRI